MIVTSKMQHTVEGENFDLFGRGVTKPARILRGNFSGDGNLASQTIRGDGWKRKHIGWLILATKAAVEVLQFVVAGDQNVDLAA